MSHFTKMEVEGSEYGPGVYVYVWACYLRQDFHMAALWFPSHCTLHYLMVNVFDLTFLMIVQ